MTTVDTNSKQVRRAGVFMILGSLIALISSGLSDPQVYMSSDPLQRLLAIAGRRWGWDAEGALVL